MNEGKRILRIDDSIDIDVFGMTSARFVTTDYGVPLSCTVFMTSGDSVNVNGFHSLMLHEWLNSYIRKGLTIDVAETKAAIRRHFLHTATHATYRREEDRITTATVHWPHGVSCRFNGDQAQEVFDKMGLRTIYRARADEESRERYQSPITRPGPRPIESIDESWPQRPGYASDRQWGMYLAYLRDGGTLGFEEWQRTHKIPGPSVFSTPREATAAFNRDAERILESDRQNPRADVSPTETDGLDPLVGDPGL